MTRAELFRNIVIKLADKDKNLLEHINNMLDTLETSQHFIDRMKAVTELSQEATEAIENECQNFERNQ